MLLPLNKCNQGIFDQSDLDVMTKQVGIVVNSKELAELLLILRLKVDHCILDDSWITVKS